jgi:cbb3-type cytochrome oxidase maturation protein
MGGVVWLLPVCLGMGLAGLLAFLWCLHSGQYEDLHGASQRILFADDTAPPGRAGSTVGTKHRTPGEDVATAPPGN